MRHLEVSNVFRRTETSGEALFLKAFNGDWLRLTQVTFLCSFSMLHLRCWVSILHLATDNLAEPWWGPGCCNLLQSCLLFVGLTIYSIGGALACFAAAASGSPWMSLGTLPAPNLLSL